MSLLGLDLGTGTVKMAYPDTSGKPTVLTNQYGESSFRSTIFLEGDQALIGNEADNAGFLDPARCIRVSKRHMGTDDVLAVSKNGQEYRARDCAQLLIAEAVSIYEQKLGRPPQCVVIGIPANFNQRQRDETMQAAEALGLEVPLLVNEPTAAAMGNAIHEKGDGFCLVVDVGHGTTDVSLLRVSGAQLVVVGTDGEPQIGGYDFSGRIEELVLDRFEAKHGFRPAPDAHAQSFLDLAQHVAQAKHSLARLPSANIMFTCDGHMLQVILTREEFKDQCRDLTDKLMHRVSEVLARADVESGDLKEVLAVGGGSLMPIIPEALEQTLGLKPLAQCEPTFGVAYGCVLAGRMELQRQGRPLAIDGKPLPPVRFCTRDIISHDMGVTILDDARQNQILHAILHRGTTIPCDRTMMFRLAEDGQTDARIELLEGDDGASREDCLVLGHFDLEQLPPTDGAAHGIEIRFQLDQSGLLTATAKDTVSSKNAELSVAYQSKAPSTS